MNCIKEKINLDLQKLSSGIDLFLTDERSISRLDIDLLMDLTRRLHENLFEIRLGLDTNSVKSIQPDFEKSPTPVPLPHSLLEEEESKPLEDFVPEVHKDPSEKVKFSIHEETIQPISERVPSEYIATDSQNKAQEPEKENHTLFALPVEDLQVEDKKPDLLDYIKQAHQSKKNVESELQSGETTTLAEKFKNQNNQSVFDKISPGVEKESVEHRIQQSYVNDIRQIIGINEKFLFINELFEGDMRIYNDFILTLNTFETSSEAKFYLDSCTAEKNWDKQSLSYVSFLKIFERKFS